jgi:divalent metal cation (Fe/Co/Zn/Cd) transporter
MTTATPNPKPITAYCRVCGKPLTEDEAHPAQGTIFCAEHVPATGQATTARPTGAPPHSAGASPGLAFLLGLIPGVGAIYNGQYAKGIVHVLILGLLISLESSGGANGLEALVGMLIGVFYFYMAFEAYHTARKRLAGEPVDEFSSLIQLRPEAGKVPVVPVLLIALGVLFLLNNIGWLRMDEILKYWPVALIVLGAWMLFERLRPSPKPEPPLAGPTEHAPIPPAEGGAL